MQDRGASLWQLERRVLHCCSRSCVWGQPWGHQTAREATDRGCLQDREASTQDHWLPWPVPKVSPPVSVFPLLWLSSPTGALWAALWPGVAGTLTALTGSQLHLGPSTAAQHVHRES